MRLHRAGEHAPYTGLKPAGDHGPAIPAAERALESHKVDALVKLLSEHLAHGVAERFGHALESDASKTPAAHAGVDAARRRVSAELEFVGYIEALYRAVQGAPGHSE